MFTVKAKIKSDFGKVKKAADTGTLASLDKAAGAIRLTARRSIRRSKTASRPGQPPHTRRGWIKMGILYAVERIAGYAVIGPDAERVGNFGAAREFGLRYKTSRYLPRPFMGPAFEKMKPRLPAFWAGSVR